MRLVRRARGYVRGAPDAAGNDIQPTAWSARGSPLWYSGHFGVQRSGSPQLWGFDPMRKNFVLPLNLSHRVQQLVEFFGREACTEARDPLRDFTTHGSDGVYFSSVIHSVELGGIEAATSLQELSRRERLSPLKINFALHQFRCAGHQGSRRSLVRVTLEARVPLVPAMRLVAGRTHDRIHLFDRRCLERLWVHRETGVNHFPGRRTLDQYSVQLSSITATPTDCLQGRFPEKPRI